jgi:hypothetical protein
MSCEANCQCIVCGTVPGQMVCMYAFPYPFSFEADRRSIPPGRNFSACLDGFSPLLRDFSY